MKPKIVIAAIALLAVVAVASPVIDALKRRTNRAIAIAAKNYAERFPDYSEPTAWQQYSNLVAVATNSAQLKAVWTNLPPEAWKEAGEK